MSDENKDQEPKEEDKEKKAREKATLKAKLKAKRIKELKGELVKEGGKLRRVVTIEKGPMKGLRKSYSVKK